MNPHMRAPFRQYGSNVTISATAASANAILPRAVSQTMVVVNQGTSVVFIKAGNSAVAAEVTDDPVPVGAKRVLSVGPTDTHVAAICPGAGTATVYFSVGDGQIT